MMDIHPMKNFHLCKYGLSMGEEYFLMLLENFVLLWQTKKNCGQNYTLIACKGDLQFRAKKSN